MAQALQTRTPVSRWRLRQLARSALAATLPRRCLLVSGPAGSRAVCLTFDDGPHPEHTPRLLDVLRELGARATFFVIGQNVERYPDLVRRMTAEGHVVGHHSFLHSEPRQTPARQLLEEVQRTQELLIPLIGKPSALFRPPHGKVTVWKLWSLWRAGQTVVLWNVDSKDYTCQSGEELRTWFEKNLCSGGDIVLMHDNHPHAAGALPGLAEAMRRDGLTFATVQEWVSPHGFQVGGL